MATSSFSLTLPSSEYKISFRSPTGKDQRLALSKHDRENGLVAEFIIAMRCLEEVNGVKLDPEEYVENFDALEYADFNYYFDVFAFMFLRDEEKRDLAKDVAKKLLNGESIVGTPKKSAVTAPTGKKEDSVN